MSPIRSIETFHVSVPTRREHKWTGLTESIGGYVLVRACDADGNVGWGEAPVLKDWAGEFGRYFGESPLTAIVVIRNYLAPAVVGADPSNLAELHQRMDRQIKGFPYAKAAVETAVLDLAGRAMGKPSWTFLGGYVRDSVPVTHSIGLISIEDAEREAGIVAAEGIRTIKIKVGVDPRRDVEIVKRVRAAAGPKVELCVDANQGYATPGEAIRTFRKIEAQEIKYFEQPVEGIARLAEVQRALDVPVMADESAWNGHDVIEIIEKRAAQIVSIYTTKPGGLYRAMEVAAVCRAAGIICNVNGSVELGVGNRANILLAACAPAVTLSSVVPISTPAEHLSGRIAGIYYRDDLLTEPMEFCDGAVVLPKGPGLGIDVDDSKVRKYVVSRKGDQG
jgi:muconate cycloisomerase